MATSITSIKGISTRRAEVLREAGIATISDIAASSPETLRDIVVASGQRVDIANVRKWVSEARALEAETWRRAASFVITFEERIEDGQRERRTVVEQTEVDTDPAPNDTWPGWDCSQVCEWMQDQSDVGPSEGAPGAPAEAEATPRDQAPESVPIAGPEPAGEPHTPQPATAEPGGRAAAAPSLESTLRIVGATLVDSVDERVTLVEHGEVMPSIGAIPPSRRLIVTIEPPVGRPALVAARFWHPSTGGRAIVGPIDVPAGSTNATLDLPDLSSGEQRLVVAVWLPDALVAPASRALTFLAAEHARST